MFKREQYSRKEVIDMKNCALCLKKGPHFHIMVENGYVTSVWYISTKSYWDRELPQDEYTGMALT
jgi:hypothetical protein